MRAEPSNIKTVYQITIKDPIAFCVTTTIPNSSCCTFSNSVYQEPRHISNDIKNTDCVTSHSKTDAGPEEQIYHTRTKSDGQRDNPIGLGDTGPLAELQSTQATDNSAGELSNDVHEPFTNELHRVYDDIVSLRDEEWSEEFSKDYPKFWHRIKGNEFIESEISRFADDALQQSRSGQFDQMSLAKLLLKMTSWPAIMRDIVFLRVVLALSKRFKTVRAIELPLGYRDKSEGESGALRKKLSQLKIGKEVRYEPRRSKVLVENDLRWIEDARKYHI